MRQRHIQLGLILLGLGGGAPGCVVEEEAPDAEVSARGVVSPDAGERPHDGLGAGSQSSCPAQPTPLDACLHGLTFATCPGEGSPALYCTPGVDYQQDCLWFANGCPAEEYSVPCPEGVNPNYGHSDPVCMVGGFWRGWGPSPWDREREMNLDLDVIDLEEALTPQLSCSACEVLPGVETPEGWSGGCGHPIDTLCGASDVCARQPEAPQVLRQIVSVEMGLCEHLGAYDLIFELDIERARARACVVESSDASADPRVEPLCAASGVVQLSAALIEGAPLTGRFELRFPEYAPRPYSGAPFLRGVELTGSF